MGKPDYWSNICAMQKRQTEKGLRKYGQILEDNTVLSMVERITHAQEESIDFLMYLEHMKQYFIDREDDGK